MLIIIILFLIIISCIYIILSYKTKGAPLPTGVAKCVCVPHHSLDPKYCVLSTVESMTLAQKLCGSPVGS